MNFGTTLEGWDMLGLLLWELKALETPKQEVQVDHGGVIGFRYTIQQVNPKANI